MEYENKYGSRGATGAALGLGIAGTALGVLNNGGGLGGLLGGNCRNNGADAAITAAALLSAGNSHNCCTAHAYNRYDAEKDAIIARLETEVKLRDSYIYTDGRVSAAFDKTNARIDVLERELADQRTYNAVNTATIGCIRGQVDTLMGLTRVTIPNSSVCPGWGDVTVTPAAAPAAGA